MKSLYPHRKKRLVAFGLIISATWLTVSGIAYIIWLASLFPTSMNKNMILIQNNYAAPVIPLVLIPAALMCMIACGIFMVCAKKKQ